MRFYFSVNQERGLDQRDGVNNHLGFSSPLFSEKRRKYPQRYILVFTYVSSSWTQAIQPCQKHLLQLQKESKRTACQGPDMKGMWTCSFHGKAQRPTLHTPAELSFGLEGQLLCRIRGTVHPPPSRYCDTWGSCYKGLRGRLNLRWNPSTSASAVTELSFPGNPVHMLHPAALQPCISAAGHSHLRFCSVLTVAWGAAICHSTHINWTLGSSECGPQSRAIASLERPKETEILGPGMDLLTYAVRKLQEQVRPRTLVHTEVNHCLS
ncbi:hypothetical protein TREES_T100014596 [Tupaia chinensis]|uniref:Uncharacterized protein n=1 Tax=Tupaia chinensis TaxID=246437 RepID=L9L5P0_TUPCH|nr:hypothetical protein TREES_T100014596 [Tupaia chinensis]